MGFWTAIFLIAFFAIITGFVLQIVKMAMRHYENIERIKRGYPTKDGAVPFGTQEPTHDEHMKPYVHGDRLQ